MWMMRLVKLATPLSWVTTMMVIFSFSFNSRRRFIISTEVFESKAPVGSSARMISGFVINARAIATLCF